MYRSVLCFLLLCCLGGCVYDPERCRYPNLFHPGHIDEQQGWARSFDPYSRSEVGPKIVGDRPGGALDQTPNPQRPPYSQKSQ